MENVKQLTQGGQNCTIATEEEKVFCTKRTGIRCIGRKKTTQHLRRIDISEHVYFNLFAGA